MTDMLLYWWREFAKPMTYPKGSLIELCHSNDGKSPSSIEKTATGYVVSIGERKIGVVTFVVTRWSIEKKDR